MNEQLSLYKPPTTAHGGRREGAGRHKKDAAEKMSECVQVNMTVAEKNKLMESAKKHGLSLSELCRKIIFKK